MHTQWISDTNSEDQDTWETSILTLISLSSSPPLNAVFLC